MISNAIRAEAVRGRLRRGGLAVVLVVALFGIAAVVTLQVKSVQYGLPVSELLEEQTARLWIYETITDDGLLAPAPAFVKVRWTSDRDPLIRSRLEKKYGLEPIEARGDETWLYRLRRLSYENVRALLRDSLVRDTEGFDLRGFALPAESLSLALDRATRFGLLHLALRWLPDHRRADLAGAAYRLTDPLMRWVVFAAVAVVALPLLLRSAPAQDTGPLAATGPRLRRLAGDLLVGRPEGRSLRHSAALTLLVVAATSLLSARSLFPTPEVTNTPFAVRAIDLAVTRSLCGTTSSVAAASPGLMLLRDTSLGRLPLPDLVARAAGDRAGYCASATPFRNPENSPMLLMSAILLCAPELSGEMLGLWMHGIKLAMLVGSAFMCLAMGTGVLATYLVIAVAIDVLARLGNTYIQYSFLGVTLMFVAVAWAFVQRPGVRRTAPYDRAAAALLGVATGFAAHARTSHLFIYVAFFFLYVGLTLGRRRRQGQRAWRPAGAWLAAVGAAFALGYAGFAWTFISPINRATADSRVNYTGHAMAHALVLSLSLSSTRALDHPDTVPGNELARREGIAFEDEQGLALARRIDPTVEYLGPGYETALWSYYGQLWRRYPSEMLAIYRDKFQLTGENIRRHLLEDEQSWTVQAVGRALGLLPPAVSVFWLFAAICAGAAAVYVRSASSAACVISFCSVAAMLVYLEAALVVPQFSLTYYNFVPVYIGVLAAFGLQAALARVARALR